jgi:hypothetical protein
MLSRSRTEILAQEGRHVPSLEQAVKNAAAAHGTWHTRPGAGGGGAGLPADVSVDVTEAALGAWGKPIAEIAPAWRTGEPAKLFAAQYIPSQTGVGMASAVKH